MKKYKFNIILLVLVSFIVIFFSLKDDSKKVKRGILSDGKCYLIFLLMTPMECVWNAPESAR